MPGRVLASLIARSRPASGAWVEADVHHDERIMKHLARSSDDRPGPDERRASAKSASKSPPPAPAARLEMLIESPPLVFLGPASTSSGALLSGQLKVVVDTAEVRLAHFTMALRKTTTTKKPVCPNCPDCAGQVVDLFKWEFLHEAMSLKKGTHAFPFSHLLPGRLPASSHSALADIDYALEAQGTTVTGECLPFHRSLTVQRALVPGNDRNSIRIFPPTALTAHLTLPPVIYPIGEFPIAFRMDGLVRASGELQTRWRLRKLSWRLEEECKMISPACAKHEQKLGGAGKGMLHTETRTIGSDEYKNGWKTDLTTGDGLVEMEFKASIRTSKRPVCDVVSQGGLTVAHSLVLELVVAEECCPAKTPQVTTLTGAARILRMIFALPVTERSGLGISWDEEQPPMYDDVPPSPPTYIQMEDYVGPPLDDEDLERLPAT
ncbi:MAG: hypothetical protein M1838_000127 [Thelocarpon superellum]|nr:MAG: hypothetical protein M1838_000127 [Thelocarpon superellum]